MESELGLQVLPILFKDMECGKLNAILGEVSDSPASSLLLFGLETECKPRTDIPLRRFSDRGLSCQKISWFETLCSWAFKIPKNPAKGTGLKQLFLVRFDIVFYLEAKMPIGQFCGLPSPWRPFNETLLDQERFIDVFEGVLFLTHCGG